MHRRLPHWFTQKIPESPPCGLDFVRPEDFADYEAVALAMGFKGAPSAPFVRSSFRAAEL